VCRTPMAGPTLGWVRWSQSYALRVIDGVRARLWLWKGKLEELEVQLGRPVRVPS
jgi:hypothetical protein